MKVCRIWFGNVQLLRGCCPLCSDDALIVDGEFTCCGYEPDCLEVVSDKRESGSDYTRRRPPIAARRRILAVQEYKCFYCEDELRVDNTEWEHFLPYSYSANNNVDNFVAACAACNAFKSSKIFDTPEEARKYLVTRRKTVRVLQSEV